MLHGIQYADEVASFEEVKFGDEVALRANELQLAQQLLEKLASDRFGPERYGDRSRQAVHAAVEQKRSTPALPPGDPVPEARAAFEEAPGLEDRDTGAAAATYRALPLERSTDDPALHFNLALEDTRGASAAIGHYERALALDPEFADAHYNVAGLYERVERGADALRHYQSYKGLVEST